MLLCLWCKCRNGLLLELLELLLLLLLNDLLQLLQLLLRYRGRVSVLLLLLLFLTRLLRGGQCRIDIPSSVPIVVLRGNIRI